MMRLLILPLILALSAGVVVQAQPAPPVTPPAVDLSKALGLQELEALALANNPAMAIAAQSVNQADAGVTRARAAQMPDLTFNLNATQSHVLSGGASGTGTGLTGTTRNASLALSQTFYQSGLREQIEASRAAARAARFGQTDTRRTLVLEVAQNYFTALAAVGLADVAMRAIAASQQHLDLVDARIERGTAAKSDRYPFEVELAQARLDAISADNTAKTSLTTLRRSLGLPATTQIKIHEAKPLAPYSGKLEDLIQTAYAARPVIRQAVENAAAARQSLRVAEIQAGPVLTVAGTADYGRHTGVTGDQWQVSAGVSLPLFDAGTLRAAVDNARASWRIAEEDVRAKQLDVSAEVERSYLNLAEATERITAAEAAVTSAQVSLNAARDRYTADVGTVIDVTDAELKLRQVEADRVKARYDRDTSLAALRASIGESLATAP